MIPLAAAMPASVVVLTPEYATAKGVFAPNCEAEPDAPGNVDEILPVELVIVDVFVGIVTFGVLATILPPLDVLVPLNDTPEPDARPKLAVPTLSSPTNLILLISLPPHNPKSEEYWQELDKRVAKRLPHVKGGGDNDEIGRAHV